MPDLKITVVTGFMTQSMLISGFLVSDNVIM